MLKPQINYALQPHVLNQPKHKNLHQENEYLEHNAGPGVIRIISSWSGFGGSTTLFIELCRLFNDNGMPCIFYGPNLWHINKYKYCDNVNRLKINDNDYVIGHMVDINREPRIFRKLKNCVLSTHEKTTHCLVPEFLTNYSKIVFASQSHMEWHSYYRGPQQMVVIPTPQAQLRKIQQTNPKAEGVAGVIGTICTRKQTHVSILRALKDGCRKVFLFGNKETFYFNNCVLPLLNNNVAYYGEMDIKRKQEMYEMISCVYHSSTEEIACLVQGECEIVGIPFHGNCNVIPYEMWPNDKIVAAWKHILNYTTKTLE